MTEVTTGFCWHQNFVPWGCLSLTCSYVHLLNHEKMCIKSEVEEILFKPAINDHSDEAYPFTSKFWPLWVVCPCPMAAVYFFSSITNDLIYPQHSGERYMANGPLVQWREAISIATCSARLILDCVSNARGCWENETVDIPFVFCFQKGKWLV